MPPVLTFLIKNPLVDDFDLSSIEEIICGGAPLDSDTEETVRKKFNLKHLRQGFGLTETILVTVSKKNREKMGSCGFPVPGTQLKVRNYSYDSLPQH